MGDRVKDRAAIVLIVASLLLLTPLRGLWSGPGSPWWSPFVLWVALVAGGAWLAVGGEGGGRG